MESELMIKPQLGMFGLMKESLKTIKTNGKLMLPLLLFVLLFFSYLECTQIYLIEPTRTDLASQLMQHPNLFQDFVINMHEAEYSGALNDIRKFLYVKLVILTFSWMISLVFLVAIVSSSSQAYTTKVQNPSEMMMKIKQSWNKPLVTSFYIVLLTLGSIFVGIVSIGVVYILAVGLWVYVLYGVVFLCSIVLWMYFTGLWVMSMVVSVLEEVGGVDAIARGGELMKGGKVKALVVAVLFYVANGFVLSMRNAIISQNLENWRRMVVFVVLSHAFLLVLKLFVFVVFTVLYHEQKESCDEKKAKSLYLPVVGGEV
ncbi:hypothetical protein QVD17_00521 [Tagetes erecta]|uniref:Transmembrane protein n=1 Tax=Tagetes erecta TaxID=13708 RepID=A0AAD8LBR2_TARER|nr:hypothetical protein QVD17_00521 [Tagetes erecta]